MSSSVIYTNFLLLTAVSYVSGHGRLFQPPGRSTAWRYGFSTPVNYNDHELYCGGFARQYGKNKGKCGPCGDAYDVPTPRDNESGGKYGRGVIVKKYTKGQNIEIGVELTANHDGFFEFRLCVHNAFSTPEDEQCFEKNFLKRADGKGNRYFPSRSSRQYLVPYSLPVDVTCKQCVLQWRYVAGNNWGNCANGTGKVGCGPQEEFRSCADIQISEKDGSVDETPSRVPIPVLPEDESEHKVPSRKPDFPEDDTVDKTPSRESDSPEDEPNYNVIDVDPHVGGEVDVYRPSHAGQVISIGLAFVIVIIFMLCLLFYYLWKKGSLKTFFKERSANLPSILNPSSIISSLKMPKALSSFKKSPTPIPEPLSGPPPVPPRRNRQFKSALNCDTTVVGRPVISISSPTRVAINGVQVHSNLSSNYVPQLFVSNNIT